MSTQCNLPSPPGRGLSRRLRRSESGAAAVEFALVALPLFFILYALIAFGMMLALKQSVTSAAAEGARSAVGIVDDPATPGVDERIEKAKTTVSNRLGWLGSKYDPNDVEVNWYSGTSCSSTPPATGSPAIICVRIEYPYETRPLIPTAPGLGLLTPSTLSSEALVQVG